MDLKIYLASKSPRRRELLAMTGLEFEVMLMEDLDEDSILSEYPGDVESGSERIAREKAGLAISKNIPGIFITADTLVIADDGTVLGKPSDKRQAELFLDRLAGNWHTVSTGVAIARLKSSGESKTVSLYEKTRVKFSTMSESEIKAYIETGEPFDKAGGYGIQGKASVYVERIEGCYFNVVGFPLSAFWKMWKSM